MSVEAELVMFQLEGLHVYEDNVWIMQYSDLILGDGVIFMEVRTIRYKTSTIRSVSRDVIGSEKLQHDRARNVRGTIHQWA